MEFEKPVEEAPDADAVMPGAEAGGGPAEEDETEVEGVEAEVKERLTAAIATALRAEVWLEKFAKAAAWDDCVGVKEEVDIRDVSAQVCCAGYQFVAQNCLRHFYHPSL